MRGDGNGNGDGKDVRRELEWVRDQLRARLEKIRADANHATAPLAADSADRAQEQENDEVLGSLEESTQALLRQYERALARLDAGHYGVCETCGYAIEEGRLDRMPQATQCVSCAEAATA